MKLIPYSSDAGTHPIRPTHVFAGRTGLFTRHRLARRWPEDGERMATPAELRAVGL